MPSTTFFKVILVGALTCLLFVPLLLIWALTGERTARRDQVEEEVAASWGQRQTIGGIALIVPFEHTTTVKNEVVRTEGRLVVLPQQLVVDATLAPEVRRRAIFATTVYQSTAKLSGTFAAPDLTRVGLSNATLLWPRASLSVGLTDLRGAVSAAPVTWGEARLELEPLVADGPLGPGLGAAAPVTDASQPMTFSVELVVAGSKALMFMPTATATDVVVRSSWRHPSFVGAFLPTSHTIDASGFLARWRLAALSRPYPPAWVDGTAVPAAAARDRRNATAFGVDLVTPVDHYQQVERAVKYGFLFIAATLGLYLVWEVVGRRRVHPIQYLFVGLALVVFYLLLLSLSEHVTFFVAYVIASAATIVMVAGYSARILKATSAGAAIAGWLGTLYGLLFVLLQIEDLALLVGSIAVFAALAALMYFTRGVDWYAVREV